jgi:K+-sensing histidine kinase KdpD
MPRRLRGRVRAIRDQAEFGVQPEGLGMGLAIWRSIVESLGGRISAVANEPRGARLQFVLPAADAAQ